MLQNTKVTTNTVKSMALVFLNGQMALLILENFTITISTEKEFTHGLTIENTRENGVQIRCMVKVLSLGLTTESILESTPTIRKRAMANSSGQMEGAIAESGSTVNSMARVHTLLAKVRKNTASGKRESASDGLEEESKIENPLLFI
jgi:hypothetical protein